MSEFFSHLSVAVVVFVSTNVDDIILIAMLFADPALKPRAVVLGQLVGIGALIAVSAVAGVAALAVPEEYIALLGAVPLALGLQKLWGLRHGGPEEERARGGEEALEGGSSNRAPRARSAGSGVVSVALLTLANGGDNLGVYVPLFAQQSSLIMLYSLVFAVMTGIWCFAGYALVNHRAIGERITRHGRVALPLVLIALGVWILSGAVSLLE